MDVLKALDNSPLGRRVLGHLARKRNMELKDLDVDRVDGVDKPATGRSFLLTKRADERPTERETDVTKSLWRNLVPGCDVVKAVGEDGEDDVMTPDEKKQRGVAATKARVSFASVISPDSRASDSYPIEQQESARQPRRADEGADRLDREYSDAVHARIAGAFSSKLETEQSQIPTAGAGETWEGDTRDLANEPETFMPAGEGDAGHSGGEDRGNPSASPTQQYVNESGPVRVGNFCVMSPGNAGIADPSGFMAPAPRSAVLKRAKSGTFSNVILGPLDTGPSSNFFGD